jgi:rsbT co-antagonist protein RsbR
MIGAQVVWDGVVMDITESMRLREAEREAAEQQAIIREQSQMLAELSTPLIPISDGVLVMPLIGAISDRRAQQVMETLLEGIVHYQAETVLLDITGVKMVDTSVANALIQVARAVNLIGAHLVLTGIQPRIAQTLVQLGVSLGDIVTYSTLQAGIASILTRQRQVVLEVGRRGGS